MRNDWFAGFQIISLGLKMFRHFVFLFVKGLIDPWGIYLT